MCFLEAEEKEEELEVELVWNDTLHSLGHFLEKISWKPSLACRKERLSGKVW